MVRLPHIATPRLAPAPVPLKLVLAAGIGVLLCEVAAGLPVPAIALSPLAGLIGVRLLQILLMVMATHWLAAGWASIGLGRERLKPGLVWGLGISAAFGAATAIGCAVLWATGRNPLRLIEGAVPEKGADLLLYLTAGMFVGPVAEEIFFRGVVYGFLRRGGLAAAVLLSTALFGLAHPGSTGVPVIQLAGGLLFAMAYEASGSLLAPVLVHVLGNAAIMAVAVVR